MDEYSRDSFCKKFSSELVSFVSNEFEKDVILKVCLLQRTKHSSKKRQGGFVISKGMVNLLQRFISPDDIFYNVFEDGLHFIQQESKLWNISLSSWWKEEDNYIIEVNKAKAFHFLLPQILSLTEADVNHECMSAEISSVIFCHLDDKLTTCDIRSVLHCSILRKAFKSNNTSIYISTASEMNDASFCEIIKNLKIDIVFDHSSKMNAVSKKNSLLDLPKCFLDCLSDEHRNLYPRLTQLQNHENKTAFESKISKCFKNETCNMIRQAFMEKKGKTKSFFHICNQKNQMSARQTELFNAWWNDKHEKARVVDGKLQAENYFVHSGADTLCAIEFVETRRKQIKESFEAKLQVNLEGEEWEKKFDDMTSATIKLEYLKYSPTSRMKISIDKASLPTDVTFILYNFSRLSMLLKSFEAKVEEGYYPPVPPIMDVQFSSLVEDAEWELFVDHLWIVFDIITKPFITVDNNSVKMSFHNVIDYLQQLCRSVSTLYSRHHIMGENLPHLISTLHARIYLMKAARNVMEQIFNVLDIVPPQQM